LLYARWLDDIAPGFIARVILGETGEDYRDRDLHDQVARLIEIFGVTDISYRGHRFPPIVIQRAVWLYRRV
jgi:hypothetical protein